MAEAVMEATAAPAESREEVAAEVEGWLAVMVEVRVAGWSSE